MSPRVESWVRPIAAAMAVAVAGCSSGSAGAGTAASGNGQAPPPAGASAGPGNAGDGKDLTRAGTIVVVYCRTVTGGGPADTVKALGVVALSTADGKPAAHREAQLPKGADPGTLCRDYDTRPGAAGALRAAFNADYSLVAGRLPGPGGAGTVATAFTLQAQSAAVPAPSGDAYASSPKDTMPLFQGGTSTLWYATGDQRIMSRDLAKQDGAKERGASLRGPFALQGDQPWPRYPMLSEPHEVVINPSGTMAAAPDGAQPGIWRMDAPPAPFGDRYVDPARLGREAYGKKSLPGTNTVPDGCRPAVWPDDHTLICSAKTNLYRIRFDTAFTKAETVERLLPETDRKCRDVVLAPDGKAIAFLSEQGTTTDLYRLDLTPGATPQMVTGVQSAAVKAQGDPQLVTWQ
ncbi:TolB family protein [Kitasatospora sp. NPDC004240]